jgi:GNAT superfamily N-acetyltransferase
MILTNCTREQFVAALTDLKEDRFARTFVRKADMQKQWDDCVGLFVDGALAGAIITTISKREPRIANLQLLHTFHAYRRKGVAKYLCEASLLKAWANKCEYFRVSAEPGAVEFYERIGFKFLGKQKSGCQLSMFKINGFTYEEGSYNLNDPIINKAVYKKGKGGCIEVFNEHLAPSSDIIRS